MRGIWEAVHGATCKWISKLRMVEGQQHRLIQGLIQWEARTCEAYGRLCMELLASG